jgi:heterodisulfide reductase subunit A-like polyferredoxin
MPPVHRLLLQRLARETVKMASLREEVTWVRASTVMARARAFYTEGMARKRAALLATARV